MNLHGTPSAHRSARLKDSAEQLTAALESADRLAAAEAEQADNGALTRTETTSLVSQLSQAAAQLETTALAGRRKSFSCAATRVPCHVRRSCPLQLSSKWSEREGSWGQDGDGSGGDVEEGAGAGVRADEAAAEPAGARAHGRVAPVLPIGKGSADSLLIEVCRALVLGLAPAGPGLGLASAASRRRKPEAVVGPRWRGVDL